nr:MAG TPA: hypothetical protein [Bacteriophage sp.]
MFLSNKKAPPVKVMLLRMGDVFLKKNSLSISSIVIISCQVLKRKYERLCKTMQLCEYFLRKLFFKHNFKFF